MILLPPCAVFHAMFSLDATCFSATYATGLVDERGGDSHRDVFDFYRSMPPCDVNGRGGGDVLDDRPREGGIE